MKRDLMDDENEEVDVESRVDDRLTSFMTSVLQHRSLQATPELMFDRD